MTDRSHVNQVAFFRKEIGDGNEELVDRTKEFLVFAAFGFEARNRA